jgi:hypothetical protein
MHRKIEISLVILGPIYDYHLILNFMIRLSFYDFESLLRLFCTHIEYFRLFNSDYSIPTVEYFRYYDLCRILPNIL